MASRKLRLGLSAAAFSIIATAVMAQELPVNIQGGGATSGGADYLQELATFDNAAAAGTAKFLNANADSLGNAVYWPSGSSTGQSAFLDNNNNENCIKVLGSTSSFCANNAPGGFNAVHYAASDSALSTTQISAWATSAFGTTASGHLIQIPSLGTAIALPVINSLVTQNGATTSHTAVLGGIILTDNDLCGIFSGKITDWNQTSANAKLAPGLITVVYRNDGAGATFQLLNHFTAVCTAANSSFKTLPVVASLTFASLFPGGVLPIPPLQTVTNFLGVKLSSGMANTLANLAGGPTLTSAIGYVSPDYTTVDPNSDVRLSNGQPSPLVVAAVKLGALPYIPDVASIRTALNHGKIFNPAGPSAPPTTATAGAQTAAYVPLIETVSSGYPIVGYAVFNFAQCYASPGITKALLDFLVKGHYSATNTTYSAIINRNGFVAISNSGAKAFLTAINNNILKNVNGWNDNIGNATACAGLTGR